MSSIISENMGQIESLLRLPKTLNEPNKRWHSAFVSIYCSRALLSFFKASLREKKNTNISPSPSFIILDVKPDNRLKIDQTSLTKLVKEKNVERLENIGGVDGFFLGSVQRTPEFEAEVSAKFLQLTKKKAKSALSVFRC